MQKRLLLAALVVVLILGCKQKKPQDVVETSQIPPPDSVTIENEQVDDFGLRIDSLHVDEFRVQRNESLYLILDKFNFSDDEIYSITQQAQQFVNLRALRPGQKYRVYASADSGEAISKLVWQPNQVDYVVFDLHREPFEIYKASRPLTSKTVIASGEINSSLFESINETGAHPLLAHKMAEIFAWQIDFFRLREGDHFNVLYQKRFIDGEFYSIGNVLAAEFTHGGEAFRAYRFTNGDFDGYFDENGKSVQKVLLKTPFKFNQRISSHFSHSRFHPILKKSMPHYGVDYAAPYGTPVLAVGDGVVTEAQYRGANGNIVKIRHNSTYSTAYLHLKGFASGIHRGVRVNQGQIIGYVGNTGRATGTHLDYRIFKNNHPVNPLAIDLPSSVSVPDSLMEAFQEVKNSFDLQLNRNFVKDVKPYGTSNNKSISMHTAPEK
jgi:murein DD-endopeptidase MepM/ murein hydrolase activator NlpD